MSLPFALAGVPITVLGQDNTYTRMARTSANDRILIILQMHGGNDGLNCLVPVDAYDLYYSRRANIAIPQKNSLRKYIEVDSTLESEARIGFHPDMLAMKDMYDKGRVGIVQGVSYKNNNGSHFRGRDIWFMGGSADEYLQSGWVGRYLQKEFEPEVYPDDFPNASMPDPLAIEMGSDVSLIFHQEGNIPTSLSINDPASFAQLVEDLEGFQDEEVDPRGLPPEFLKDSAYYNELDWILNLEDKSKDYANQLFQRYEQGGAPSTSYPENYPFNAPRGSLRNPLSGQLRLVARLIAGGCKTKVYLVKIGGFDTHADQVEKYDPTMGGHAALMYHISTAMKAFQEDLKVRGLEDRVLTITTSEFGRRIGSNGSYGTDHGTGGPLFLFGRYVKPGVTGVVPDLTKGNVEMQYDYRLIYANLLSKWMQVDDTKLNYVFPGLMTLEGTKDGVFFEELPLVLDTILASDDFSTTRFNLYDCYPNPAKGKATFRFRITTPADTQLVLMDSHGIPVKLVFRKTLEPGQYQEEVSLADLPAGAYIYQLKSGPFEKSKKLIVIQ